MRMDMMMEVLTEHGNMLRQLLAGRHASEEEAFDDLIADPIDTVDELNDLCDKVEDNGFKKKLVNLKVQCVMKC